MGSLKVDKSFFINRATRIYEYWNNGNDATLSGLDALCFMVGEEANDYSKSQSLQTWLFNCNLSDTLLIMTKTGIYFLGSGKKAQYFQPLDTKENLDPVVPPFTLLTRDKATKDKDKFEKLLEALTESGGKYGCFQKERSTTEFGKAWDEKIKESNLSAIDVSLSFALLFAVKDEKEITYMKRSAEATVNAWNFLRKKFVDIVDTEKKVRHVRLADELEKTIVSTTVQGRLAQDNLLEVCYTPIIQSGKDCKLKFSAENTDKMIHYGSIVSTLGVRYMSYCSNVGRTMMVEPSKDVEEIYELLLGLENFLLDKLKPGKEICDVYKAAMEFLKEKKPDFVKYIVTANFGFVTGIEFRESLLVINEKCKQIIKPNMTFVLNLGAQNFPNSTASDSEYKTASIFLSDTVLVAEEGPAVVLTLQAKNRCRANSIRFRSNPEEPTSDEEEKEFVPILRKDARFKNRPNWTDDELKALKHGIKTVASVSGIPSQTFDLMRAQLINEGHPKISIDEARDLHKIKKIQRSTAWKANNVDVTKEHQRKADARRKGADVIHIKYKSAEVSEPAIYRQFRSWIKKRSSDWTQLTGQLSDHNEKKFAKLNSEQKLYFYKLADQLIERVDNDIGADNFYGTRDGIWNCIIWTSFLLDLASVVLPDNENDCIFPTEIPAKDGNKVMRRQIRKSFQSEVFVQYAHRLILWLHSRLGQKILTSSHKCSNPRCENPLHLVNESQELNNKRDKWGAECQAHRSDGCVLECKCSEVTEFCVPNKNGIFVGCHGHGFDQGCWEKAMRLQDERELKRDSLLNSVDEQALTLKLPSDTDVKAITPEIIAQFFQSLPRIKDQNPDIESDAKNTFNQQDNEMPPPIELNLESSKSRKRRGTSESLSVPKSKQLKLGLD